MIPNIPPRDNGKVKKSISGYCPFNVAKQIKAEIKESILKGTPVANLELRISPRIFEKNRNGLDVILWGWGETDS